MSNPIFTSDLNPTHLIKYGYSLNAKYHHKDIYDDQFQNRTEGFISQPQYAQKWQFSDTIVIQFITNGIGIVNVNFYNNRNRLIQTIPMVIMADPGVPLPYVRQDLRVSAASFSEGFYYYTLSNGNHTYRISEWMDIREDHHDTLLFEYYHTWDKFNTFFTDGAGTILPFMLRVEAKLMPWREDSTFVDYTDEPGDHEVIDGMPLPKRDIILGNGYGLPDYLGLKVGKILLLNRTYIDGERYSRSPGAKMTPKKKDGHPMYSYTQEIMKAINTFGLATDETGSVQDPFIAATIDASAFGVSIPGSVFNIQARND